MAKWQRFKRGKPEMQAGGIMMLVGVAGLTALSNWEGSFPSADPTTLFTTYGFAAGVLVTLFAGVFVVGLLLFGIGAGVWLVQRVGGRD